MKLLYVEMENMLSIGHIRIDFEDSGLVLMDGWNFDDNSANGAGKTAAFIGIPVAAWDKIPRKMTKSELLRTGTKKGYSKIGVDINGDTYEAKRSRPNKVQFYKNNIEVDMTQEEWEEKIGLSYSQYLITMYSAQTQGKKLIDMNDTQLKDFILELMDLEKFSVKKKETDIILKDFYSQRLDQEKIINSCNSKLEVYNEQKIDLSAADKITQLDYSELEKKLVGYQAVKRPDISKYITLKKKIAEKQEELKQSQVRQSDLKIEIRWANENLTAIDCDKISCPECDTEIVNGDTVTNKKASLKKKIATLTKEHKSFPNLSIATSELNKILEKAISAQQKEEATYLKARERISEISSKINIRKANIQALQKQLHADQARIKNITQVESEKLKANTELTSINDDIEIWETVSMTLAPTGAPAYIMDAVVDVFNEKILDYISDIWGSASYRIQSFKENSDGAIKAKFSNKLVIAGRDRSIGSLSGGEYKCLSLAMDFAIMDVVESMFGIHMSPIVLDEPFEGLDTSNRERVIALLEKRSQKRQIFVIDHASEAKAMFSKIMNIEKRNGISSLVI